MSNTGEGMILVNGEERPVPDDGKIPALLLDLDVEPGGEGRRHRHQRRGRTQAGVGLEGPDRRRPRRAGQSGARRLR